MVHFMVCGILLGFLVFKISRHLESRRDDGEFAPSTNLVWDLRRDLGNLFYGPNSGPLVGPLEPLNDLNIFNNLKIVEDQESYTLNKKIIHLCTRDLRSKRYYDKNTLMFVVLHELAHVLCRDIGHTDNFSTINQALLDYAIARGYYDPRKPFVKNYCSL
ncbi:hypothetical protein MIV042R [Invertebrate iridescent virus 3]|uniref:Uncharacterized protein 042R n=1 Tax=Invertebrate iridescent virus 3 TaxID=345201 RepID=VF136_IIV3|nr:hypothetical protein MIV042R [Invertebrate iridescent virus 3]Q197B8.1 RecName: Full=Uncharacterized protein 042R [Invertebrate iridescent virus 3]ABF82072.1 hypothetical protein MIV042R [Invertebrate iridescent virus 3]